MNSSPRPSITAPARAHGTTRAALACCIVLAAALPGCSRCAAEPAANDGDAAARSADAAPPDARAERSTSIRVPVGPRFAVLPGKGISAIRLGATVPTIERHMQAKCEELTATRCRYVTRAVDFELENGVTQAIYINSPERRAGGVEPDGTPRAYGVFNGMILPDLVLGMTPQAIQEHLGPPQRVEKAPPNPHSTELVHHYDGLVLEYDRIERTGLLALGGIRIVK